MNGKPISPELAQSTPDSSRHFSFTLPKWLRKSLWWCAAVLLFVGIAVIEIRTSFVQSWVFTRTNERVFYNLGDGRSPAIVFPRPAPFDDRRGYSKLGVFQSRLEAEGYRVTQQVRQSPAMRRLLSQGISPPYIEPPETGMDIGGADGVPLFRYAQSDFLFKELDEIPQLLVKTLLFLENRDLDRPASSWQNPVIEWDRLFKAFFLYAGSKLHLPMSVQGGSTLAVQLEKFRHSPNGRTDTPVEKFRQVVGASLKAYRAGKNTRAWRERIIIDYLNTVPLAAAPGYGEIHGIGEGLYAWFGTPLGTAVAAINKPGSGPEKLRAFKQILTLLVSVRSPSVFLVEERSSLEEKVNQFTRLMAREGIIDWEFATDLQETPVQFLEAAPLSPQPSSARNKAANAIRTTMMDDLGVTNLYDLNRLHLAVQSTIDVPLQKSITAFLQTLSNEDVIKARGLNGEHLLEYADPKKVIYSFLLVEPTPQGNMIRVQADNLSSPFDFNKGVKLELGSTAKLRTITHYLEIMAELHRELSPLDAAALKERAQTARDPLTKWAIDTIAKEKNIGLEAFLAKAVERKYSASPYEAFFTGGGVHQFENFEREENSRILMVHEAFRDSTNLVFIRLMRDVVMYHRARLSYDADDVLGNPENVLRQRMLNDIADEEARSALRHAYQHYTKQTPDEIVKRLLPGRRNTARHLAVLFFAWHIGTDEDALTKWLEDNDERVAPEAVAKLFRAYKNPRLTLTDYAYLLSVHPVDLWCATEYRKDPNLSWDDLFRRSKEARRIGSAWLLNPRNRRAQDLRLRIQIEKDAFARMLPYWQRLGFPFKTMVPSYATAIGSSSDRPLALAELVGILVNDGVRRPATGLTNIHFASGTPYETVLEKSVDPGERVILPEVARTVRKVMTEVVEQGTARRLNGVFRMPNGEVITAGGKTGSGDNRFGTFNRWGGVISSRVTNRTAAFVFYIGDRYYGVITAFVQGREAGNYKFTSALPVTILRFLAPTINAKLQGKTPQLAPAETIEAPAAAQIRSDGAVPSSRFQVQRIDAVARP
jgi:membrane peptidoglycan carboxypeptidase